MLAEKFVKSAKFISVEPIIFSASLAIFLYSIISSEYIYFRIAKDHGININSTDDTCAFSSNGTANNAEALKKVSAETSDWMLYTNLAGFF